VLTLVIPATPATRFTLSRNPSILELLSFLPTARIWNVGGRACIAVQEMQAGWPGREADAGARVPMDGFLP
jgi:hypothetical protein